MSVKKNIRGITFEPFVKKDQEPFDKLFEIFSELIIHTSGDVDEALDWMDQLDRDYKFYTKEYGKAEFIEQITEVLAEIKTDKDICGLILLSGKKNSSL